MSVNELQSGVTAVRYHERLLLEEKLSAMPTDD